MTHKPEIDRNPHLPLERMAGSDIARPLAYLTALAIDSFRFDGHRFTSVDDRYESRDGRVKVVCGAEDGTRLLLDYNPTDSTEPLNFTVLSLDEPN